MRLSAGAVGGERGGGGREVAQRKRLELASIQGPLAVRSTETGSPASASRAVAFLMPATRASSLPRLMEAWPRTVS